MRRFILIDGNAIVHRAFHGLPPLNSPTGEMVNAVYGFFSMLLKILEDYKPDYLVVCFDRPKPTFRKQLYVGYQAKRPSMDEGLSPQFGLIREVLQKAKVSLYDLDGYEADDLIGTLSHQIVQENKKEPVEVIIFSGDRDLLQLVNPHVKMLAPLVGITTMTMFDEQKVEEKYGLTSSQIVDYKALVGDASDNYPGVSGIGPKTASDLLRRYKTFENLYEHIGELPEKVAIKLATDAEQAALCKKLATIVTDAPIHLKQKESECTNIDKESLKKSFEEYNFQSLLKRLDASKSTTSITGTTGITGKKEKVEKVEKKEENGQLGFL